MSLCKIKEATDDQIDMMLSKMTPYQWGCNFWEPTNVDGVGSRAISLYVIYQGSINDEIKLGLEFHTKMERLRELFDEVVFE